MESSGSTATGAATTTSPSTDHTEQSNNVQQQKQVHQSGGAERKEVISLEATPTLVDIVTGDAVQWSTLLDVETQSEDVGGVPSGGGDTQIDHDLEKQEPNLGHESDEHELDHAHELGHEQSNADSTHLEHLPEPPASPTLLSTPSNSDAGGGTGMKVELPSSSSAGKSRVPSANRISISYAGGNRRLVIDAEVVQSMKVLRQDGMIEVVMDVTKLNENELKGILVNFPFFYLQNTWH